MSNFTTQLAKAFTARAKEQGMKGKVRERAALEFFMGALAAVLETQGEKSENFFMVSFACILIATRGYSELERWIKEDSQS